MTMSLGFGVGDVLAIIALARRVHTAYNDAPGDYRNISVEVKSLQILVNKAALHLESSSLSENNRQQGQEVLRGCQVVLEDLNALIEKYPSLASTNTNQIVQRIRLGKEDIAALRLRLISNTCLLNGFIQSCEFFDMQARLTEALGLHYTNSRGSIDSITSFAGSSNTKNAYRRFCKGLYKIGVTAAMITQKEREIHEIFKPQSSATSNQTDDCSTLADQGQSSDAETSSISSIPAENESKYRSRFAWVRRSIDFLVGPLMLAAAEAGNTERLLSTLEYVRNINFAGDERSTALHKAAAKGHTDIVQLLLAEGASTEAGNQVENTPLHLAALYGHLDTVKLLLEHGASIEAVNSFINIPLNYIACNDNTSTAEQLLLKGASSEAMNTSKNTPLHLAAWGGHSGTVGLLLSKGAAIEAMNHFNYTPLHLAAREGHASTVELLLANGASINAVNCGGNNALLHATWKGHTSTVRLLLEKDACIRAENNNKSTPLHHAAWGGHTEIVELLLKSSAPIEVANKDNDTPLHLAARKGHTDAVILLQNRAAELATLGNIQPVSG